ncbi:MFS transporter [Umezawaea sp. Da 62-37]|uniref:MFS transporter n=1 Tax=Umezawaea sp. Da 62-37 TaxID=3075927 RepID=UPI0028F73FB8|nr:MFS transporter [Umezawaea sp. Da 62-37]WNV92059.1 MFS transporter [Umezawaea sp. Da 62-37]
MPAPLPTRSPTLIVAVLASGGLAASLMQSLVIPLIPEFPRLLHASPVDTSWVITATLLAAAVITPVSGRLGDLHGKRRVLLASLFALVVGSVVSALTESVWPMVVGRVLQGCAMGVVPLGISIMRDQLPAERVGAAMGLMSATLGVGGAIGLPLSAIVAQKADWHVLFWGSAVLGIVCATLVRLVVPESPRAPKARFDLLGAVWLSVGLTALLMATIKGAGWGWTSAATLGLFGTAVVVLPAWGVYQLRTTDPLVDLRVSARRPVLLTNLTAVLIGFAMYASALLFPQLLQAPVETGQGFGLSMVRAGLAVAPLGLVMMLLSPLSARLSARYGARTTLLIGVLVIAIGNGTAVLLTTAVWQIVVASAVMGGGIGIAFAAMPALIMGSVPQGETASANGVNTLMRSIGTSTASAVLATILANTATATGPSRVGFHISFVTAVCAALVGLLLAAFIPRERA